MPPSYFINPAIDALPEATGEERQKLIRLIAANVGDEAALRAIIGIDPDEFANFYPDMLPPELSTEETIDTFISKFASEKAAAAPEIEEIVPAPAIDYVSLLASEQGEAKDAEADTETDSDSEVHAGSDATSDAISAFLAAVPPAVPRQSRPKAPEPAAEPSARHNEADPELSEALFRLMVKNKNYRKALEIINELSLNNPKKSIYFAYQIRFLEKLIKNQEKERR